VVSNRARILCRPVGAIALFLLTLTTSGCLYVANRAAGGGVDAAVGEQHDLPYNAHDSFLLVQDVLRGEGVLFEVKPDDSLVTLWRDADKQAGVLGSLVGVHPQYRYEIGVVPQGEHRSRVIVNVRTQDMPDDELSKYQATTRLNLFMKIDQLAAKYPPNGGTPNEGGVNYAVLPNEDLKALAKRATGDPNNWQKIAADNGLKNPTDASSMTSVWIRNSLLSPAQKSSGNL
jgi:hypothetical protein